MGGGGGWAVVGPVVEFAGSQPQRRLWMRLDARGRWLGLRGELTDGVAALDMYCNVLLLMGVLAH